MFFLKLSVAIKMFRKDTDCSKYGGWHILSQYFSNSLPFLSCAFSIVAFIIRCSLRCHHQCCHSEWRALSKLKKSIKTSGKQQYLRING